jgi:hypothetical protein
MDVSEKFEDIIPADAAFDFLRHELEIAKGWDLPPRYLRLVAYGIMTADEARTFHNKAASAA